MKEWLNTKTYEYKQAACMPCGGDWIGIPEGAECLTEFVKNGEVLQVFWKETRYFLIGDDECWVDVKRDVNEYLSDNPTAKLVWQRATHPEELPFIDDEPKSLNDQYSEIEQVRQHHHYFKDVSNLDEIDVYMVLKLFNVTDPCLQHIAKKALCAGQRGHKDFERDLQDILDTAKRAIEINKNC